MLATSYVLSICYATKPMAHRTQNGVSYKNWSSISPPSFESGKIISKIPTTN